jgi:signal transduction histidine kinase
VIRVSVRQQESSITLSVTDTGEGIAPGFLPHVFDRFRQGDSATTRKHGGLGLGLAIVLRIVELHGGAIRAESAGRGKGAAFIVDLPALNPEMTL